MIGPGQVRAVQPGDPIAIAAPAGPVDPRILAEGEDWLRGLGFEVRRRSDLLDRDGYLAGDDARRADEWMEWIEDGEVAGIVCARGGYGCHRIMDRLDPEAVARAAKPIIGYSDVTTLLLWQWRQCDLMGFHGPMLDRGRALTEESRESLGRALRGEELGRLEGTATCGGRAQGRLMGGSLSLLVASLGTPWEIDTDGAILMLEEIAEQPYRIDRMLQQLRFAGKLEGLVGVGIGQMVDCEGTRYPVPTAEQVLSGFFEPLGVPVVADLPFGHCDRHLAWPLGGLAVVDGDRGSVEMLDRAAA
ncbi:MAG: S66 peptidase family protein [Myxococcota bacterium]